MKSLSREWLTVKSDIYILKIRGPALKFCMPMISSKPPIVLFEDHELCTQILIESVKQQKWKHSSAHIYLKGQAAYLQFMHKTCIDFFMLSTVSLRYQTGRYQQDLVFS